MGASWSPCPASGVVSTLSGEVCGALAYCDCVGDHLDLTGVALGSLRMPSSMPTPSPTIARMMGSTLQRVRPPNHVLLAFRSNNPKRRLLKCLLPLYNYSLFISIDLNKIPSPWSFPPENNKTRMVLTFYWQGMIID